MRYPNAYVWLVFFSAMDVMLTWLILDPFGGEEVNPIAELIIDTWGWVGAAAFKFALTLFAILMCEATGRLNDAAGRRLSIMLVGVAMIPVVWSLFLLFMNRDTLEVVGL